MDADPPHTGVKIPRLFTIKALVGHVDAGDVTAGYGGDDEGFIHDLAVLADAVATISITDLDLSYLVGRSEALGW